MLICVPPSVEVRLDQAGDVVDAALVLRDARVELDLHRRRVAPAGLHGGDGHGHGGGRAVLAEAGVGVGAVRDGRAGVAAVGRGPRPLPMRIVCAQEKRPGIML